MSDVMMLDVRGRRMAPQRIFCVGRNYAAHAAELGNEAPREPVIFMKPASALLPPEAPIRIPSYGRELHFEAEIVVAIGRSGRVTSEAEARGFIAGLGVGLDLTLRDVQRDLKAAGLPWERAKAFDGAAPLGPLVALRPEHDLGALTFTCAVDGVARQSGDSSRMLFSIARLLVAISEAWALKAGDLIYTGTPEGVGALTLGQRVEVASPFSGRAAWRVG